MNGKWHDITKGDSKTWHYFDQDQLHALTAAEHARRPLLVSGEPGLGKTQFAEAAADLLSANFLKLVIRPDSTVDDLLWSVDYTQRLSDAQEHNAKPIEHYLKPGHLCWAVASRWLKEKNYEVPLGLQSAHEKTVVLIDEIDKADASLANSLLDLFGARTLPPAPGGQVAETDSKFPIVVITSNNERQLPIAFMRRCLQLKLGFPEEPSKLFTELALKYYPDMHTDVVNELIRQTIDDRNNCYGTIKTGQAEFVDLLHTLNSITSEASEQRDWLKKLGKFFLRSGKAIAKHD